MNISHARFSMPTSAPGGTWADPEAFAEFVLPMLAGARARGVADAFDLMGLAAVLLDATGRVLHVSARAERMMDGGVRLVEGQLLGWDDQANDVLQKVTAEALRMEAPAPSDSAWLTTPSGGKLRVRAQPVPVAEDDGVQLLRAVLVLAED